MAAPPPAKRIKLEPKPVSSQKRKLSTQPVLKARLTDVRLFSQVLHAIGQFQDEVEFQFNASGLTVFGMDPAHVSCFYYGLLSTAFESYDILEHVTFGIYINEICGLIDPNKDTGSMEIEVQTSDPDTFDLRFFGTKEEEKTGPRQIIKLTCVHITQDRLALPTTDYATKIECTTSAFFQYMKQFKTLDASAVNVTVKTQINEFGPINVLTLDVKERNASLSCRFVDGVEDCKITINDAFDHTDDLPGTEFEAVALSFSFKYLAKCLLAGNLFKTVHINLHPGVPIKCHYNLQREIDDETTKPKKTKIVTLGYLTFFLAPKVDENNEAQD